MVLRFDLAADVGEGAAQQHDARETAGEDQLEQLRELVDPVGAAEEFGVLAEARRGRGDGGQRHGEGPGPRELRAGLAERDDEERQRAAEQHEFGEELEDESHPQGVASSE